MTMAINDVEAYKVALQDLQLRFEQSRREQFVRRETLTRLSHALQDKTAALLRAEATIEGLSRSLSEWQKLAEENPQLPLHLAMGELSGLADPFDVDRLEDLPPCRSASETAHVG